MARMAAKPLAIASPWPRCELVTLSSGPEGGARADRRGFLADRDVGGAAVVVARQRVVAARAEADDHLLQLADGEHVVEQVEGAGAGDPPGGNLRAGVAGEIEAADRAQRLLERREVRSGVAPVGRLRDHCVHLGLLILSSSSCGSLSSYSLGEEQPGRFLVGDQSMD